VATPLLRRSPRCSAAVVCRARTCTPCTTSSTFCIGNLCCLRKVAAWAFHFGNCIVCLHLSTMHHTLLQVLPQQLEARRRRARSRTGIWPPHSALNQQQHARAAAAQRRVCSHAVPAPGAAAGADRNMIMACSSSKMNTETCFSRRAHSHRPHPLPVLRPSTLFAARRALAASQVKVPVELPPHHLPAQAFGHDAQLLLLRQHHAQSVTNCHSASAVERTW
jgi:hypothetical protein